jgi:hypothetical protein
MGMDEFQNVGDGFAGRMGRCGDFGWDLWLGENSEWVEFGMSCGCKVWALMNNAGLHVAREELGSSGWKLEYLCGGYPLELLMVGLDGVFGTE